MPDCQYTGSSLDRQVFVCENTQGVKLAGCNDNYVACRVAVMPEFPVMFEKSNVGQSSAHKSRIPK